MLLMAKENKLGGRVLLNLIMFGFMGQVAWNVENMFFNTFLYNSVYHGVTQDVVDNSLSVISAINIMVAASAAVAVITTFLMGALSDRLNRRKIFISLGYVLWGITVAVFGFINRENTELIFHLSDPVKILTVTVTIVIVMDCVMTFMGSTANDSAFNAWVTDVTNTHNRGTAEGILAIMPVAAMAVVMGLGGMVSSIGYDVFFIALGVFVSLCGVVGFFSIRETGTGVKQTNGNYFQDLIYGFRPSVVKKNAKLYLTLCASCIFNIAVQTFFPYLFIYLQHGLNFNLNDLLSKITPTFIIIALVVVVALVGGLVGLGKLIDKLGKKNFILVSVALFVIGLFASSFMHSLGLFALSFLPGIAGYGMLMILLNAAIRDFTPKNKVGLFQGVRMIFLVLLPMVIGPTVGNFTIRHFESVRYVNEYGVTSDCPGSSMFAAAALIGILILIPVLILRKKGFEAEEDTVAE